MILMTTTQSIGFENSAILVANSNHVSCSPIVCKVGKIIIVKDVSEEHHAMIEPRKSITLYGIERNRISGPVAYETTFKIGDPAEYNSYNISYVGEITSITEKTVTIVAYKGTTSARTYRLSLEKFEWRNRMFNAKETSERNAAWTD